MSGSLAVGSRVCDKKSGSRGTVRYVGPVSISYKDPSAVWAGVEWDEEGRGKYDGSVTDKHEKVTRYFTCHPTKGSFIKPSKLAPRQSFLEAVKAKYLTHDAINSEYRGAGSIKISAEWENHKTFDVELVGVDKIQKHLQLSVIDKISLENENVAHFQGGGDSEPLGEAIPNVEELNLENTLLSSWDDVFHLLRQLPKLQRLYVSSNRLAPAMSLPEAGTTFALRVLVLNDTQTTWDQVVSLATYFPHLEELHLERNGISFEAGGRGGEAVPAASEESVTRDESTTSEPALPAADAAGAESGSCPFPNMLRLNLSYNGIRCWSSVMQFAQWPALNHLMLNGNRLDNIEWPEGVLPSNADGTAQIFAKLQCISLSENGISSWKSVDALSALPALVALNFEKNPIGGGGLGPRQVRQLLIARIGTLCTLNNSQVRRKERLDAEKQYIKVVLLETEKSWAAMDEQEQHDALKRHPRIKTLIDTHGK